MGMSELLVLDGDRWDWCRFPGSWFVVGRYKVGFQSGASSGAGHKSACCWSLVTDYLINCVAVGRGSHETKSRTKQLGL